MSDFSLEEDYDNIEDENPEDIWSALKEFNKKNVK
jgi:hypothetical protein